MQQPFLTANRCKLSGGVRFMTALGESHCSMETPANRNCTSLWKRSDCSCLNMVIRFNYHNGCLITKAKICHFCQCNALDLFQCKINVLLAPKRLENTDLQKQVELPLFAAQCLKRAKNSCLHVSSGAATL